MKNQHQSFGLISIILLFGFCFGCSKSLVPGKWPDHYIKKYSSYKNYGFTGQLLGRNYCSYGISFGGGGLKCVFFPTFGLNPDNLHLELGDECIFKEFSKTGYSYLNGKCKVKLINKSTEKEIAVFIGNWKPQNNWKGERTLLGRPSGKGILDLKVPFKKFERVKYDGYWYSRENKTWFSGELELHYRSGRYYKGSISKDSPKFLYDGIGTLKTENGSQFEGAWNNNIFVQGNITCTNGNIKQLTFSVNDSKGTTNFSQFCGQQITNQPGNGTIHYSDGRIFTGEVKCGNPLNGEMIFLNGDIYEGAFQNSTMHGYGKITYSDKGIYKGEFSNGLRHGKGDVKLPNGKNFHVVMHADEIQQMVQFVPGTGYNPDPSRDITEALLDLGQTGLAIYSVGSTIYESSPKFKLIVDDALNYINSHKHSDFSSSAMDSKKSTIKQPADYSKKTITWKAKLYDKKSNYEEHRIECNNGKNYHVRYFYKAGKWYGLGLTSSNYGYPSLEAIAKVKCGQWE